MMMMAVLMVTVGAVLACKCATIAEGFSPPQSSSCISRPVLSSHCAATMSFWRRSTISSSGCRRTTASAAATTVQVSPYLSAEYFYFDLQVAEQDIGRLVFALTIPSALPRHAENFISLARGDRRSIDPSAHYEWCEFDYTQDYVEERGGGTAGGGTSSIGAGRYRWCHVLRGRYRNGIGKADEPIRDPENLLQCTHSCYGGQYYRDRYEPQESGGGGDIDNNSEDDGDDVTVLLTVQVAGPGRGTSRFVIVRVDESPPEWRERLLLNSGVIGRLESGLDTLLYISRQRRGPPKIVKAGVLLSSEVSSKKKEE
jgi:hypothetical protein